METKFTVNGFSVTFKNAVSGKDVVIHKARTFQLSLREFLEVLDALRSETQRRLAPPAERH